MNLARFAANRKKTRKKKPTYKKLVGIVRRIADNAVPAVSSSFVSAVALLSRYTDLDRLTAAVGSGVVGDVEAAVAAERLGAILAADPTFENALYRTTALAGKATAEVTTVVAGMEFIFNATHPNVTMFARTQGAALVVDISEEAREAIRIITAVASDFGLSVDQQARSIREVVGLPPGWVTAPLNFAEELRQGRVDASRLHSNPMNRSQSARARQHRNVVASLRAGIAKGKHLDETWVAAQQSAYADRLLSRRALNIARTETLHAAHFGQNESWQQAIDGGVLPATSRRFWVVTVDERLSHSHAMIPGLNRQGRKMGEMFRTPEGPFMYPPIRTNCRCGVVLLPNAAVQPDIVDLTDEEVLALPSAAYTPRDVEGIDTQKRYSRNGKYTAERTRLHDAIVAKHLAGFTPVKDPRMVVMGGGPASGKSVMQARLSGLDNHVHVDGDNIKSMLPEYGEGAKLGDPNIAAFTHEEASDIAKRIIREGTAGSYNILNDGTGDGSFDDLARKVQTYRARGHRLVANYITVDTETAIERARARGLQTGRFVPERAIREIHRAVSGLLPRAMDVGLFDELTLWDNNGSDIFQIATSQGGNVVVINEAAWERFLAKAALPVVQRRMNTNQAQPRILTEDVVRDMVIDLTLGVVADQPDPYLREVQDELKQEIADIKEKGGVVYIPPELP